MRIIGIDPGSVVCGYGVIEKDKREIRLVEYGVVQAKKISADLPKRLVEIYDRIETVIRRSAPEAAAFESLFFSKNAQTLMKLSHARAAALVSAARCGLPIAEYAPREIKKSVTGNGNASKDQVSYMVRSMLKIDETPEFFDATDALAIAICHSARMQSGGSKPKSWSEFVDARPDMVINPNKI